MATQSSVPNRGKSASREQLRSSKGATPTESAETEERDEVYGLVSVLYHALQGAETYAQYSNDARRAGDSDLLEFFEECQEEEIDRAERAKQLLATRLEGYAEEEEGEYDEDVEENEDEDDDDDDDDK